MSVLLCISRTEDFPEVGHCHPLRYGLDCQSQLLAESDAIEPAAAAISTHPVARCLRPPHHVNSGLHYLDVLIEFGQYGFVR